MPCEGIWEKPEINAWLSGCLDKNDLQPFSVVFFFLLRPLWWEATTPPLLKWKLSTTEDVRLSFSLMRTVGQ